MEMLTLKKDEMKGKFPDDIKVPEGFVIAGGAILKWFLGEKQDSDFDYFNITGEDDWEFEMDGLKEKYSTSIHTTYDRNGKTIQVIKKPYDNIEFLLSEFDYHHCQFAYDGEDIFCTKEALICSLRKTLRLNVAAPGLELNILKRAFKYHLRGYTVSIGTIRDLGCMFSLLNHEEIDKQMIEL